MYAINILFRVFFFAKKTGANGEDRVKHRLKICGYINISNSLLINHSIGKFFSLNILSVSSFLYLILKYFVY